MEFAFDCIYYRVADLDRSIQFYREVLGLRFLSRDRVARFDVDGVLLELVPTSDERELSGTGNARLCLRVSDVKTTLKVLQRAGVQTLAPELMPEGLLGTIYDLDGNEISLWEESGKTIDQGSIWV